MKLLLIAVLNVALLGASSGDDLFKAGDFGGAETAYRAELAANKNDPAANVGMARLDLYNNRLEDALTQAQIAQTLGPRNPALDRIAPEVRARKAIAADGGSIEIPGGVAIVPFLATDPLPLMRLKINGHEANVLLDTGAPDLAVDPAFAKELNLKVSDTGEVGHFAGNKTAAMQAASVDTLDAGGLTIHHLKAMVIPSRGLPVFGNKQVDAVVGTIFLSRFLSTINYPKGQLELRPRSTVPTIAGSTPVRFWWVGDHFLFARGSVNNTPESLLLVDSGLAGGGFVPTDATIKLAHVTTHSDQAGTGIGGGGAAQFVPVTADKLCLGTLCRSNVPGLYTPGGDPLQMFSFTAAGTISHEFLKHYAVTIDFNSMQLFLQPESP
ncbi:MAG: aspartyl protease family protein [Candidatus Eremiobacteraeota bacterium]|nr:aspartyl protease family protein [Candidatus Eremiobacteraeota bacterium]